MKLEGKTNAELLAMIEKIEADPANKNIPGSIYIYAPKARKKIAELARAISSNLEDKRIAEGRPVRCDGYSGRQTNRRR